MSNDVHISNDNWVHGRMNIKMPLKHDFERDVIDRITREKSRAQIKLIVNWRCNAQFINKEFPFHHKTTAVIIILWSL